ncbi:hypothetical protein M569_13657 [Genlisea aurea]|uniref:Uncharacterized protein n=1 Tax=Genlisea aurea TaxID=192259 RepID=S8DED7_9LAMI|nr:hypothetical protein M569_13657 [Genlisea aurea]
MEELTEEEKKALRGSKFAPLRPESGRARAIPRQAHPGGPMKTNKAAALAKFLSRKLQNPQGLDSVDPKLLELAVNNAKRTVQRSGTCSTSGTTIHHFATFDDAEDEEVKGNSETPPTLKLKKKKQKQNKKKKKKKKKGLLLDSVTEI